VQTNTSITIFQVTKDWKYDKTVDAGTVYDAWVDPTTQVRSIGGIISEAGKGMFFLATNVNLASAKVEIRGALFDIVSCDAYYDRNKVFHHLEAIYK